MHQVSGGPGGVARGVVVEPEVGRKVGEVHGVHEFGAVVEQPFELVVGALLAGENDIVDVRVSRQDASDGGDLGARRSRGP